jgi:pimeloyl-ACP methyl ester carboxylesterase
VTSADWALHVQSVVLSTGIRLRYASQGDPLGAACIFLPAYADSWFSYSRLLPLLPDAVRLYAVDQRGHGDSERPACCYDVDTFAFDVVAFLDAVGVERAILVGHSGSCFVGRRVAVTHPDRVAGLVLIASPMALDRDRFGSFAATIEDLPDPMPIDFVRTFQESAVHLPMPDEFLAGLISASLKVPARVWRATLEGMLAFDDRAVLERIAAPSLLLWGDQDAIVSRSAQEDLARSIPTARFVTYAGVGHSPHWERPELVAGSIAEFVDGVSGTDSWRS